MRFAFRLTVLAASIGTATVVAQTSDDLDTVLAHVGERIAEYYKRAQSVMCIEKFTVQPIGWTFGPEGLARTTESELRIEIDADDGDGSEAKVLRLIRKINGRAPREKDKEKKDRSGCTDPNPLSPEPLAFLLPAHRSEYAFKLAGRGKGKDADALFLEFKTVRGGPRPELVEASNGRDDCYESKGTIPTQGRVSVDANSFDVLRIEEHLVGPVDLRVSNTLRRRRHMLDDMTIERLDVTMRFKRVVFRDPEDVLLLPESIDDLRVFRGGLQSTRRSQIFSEYRRFVTDARLVK